MSDLQAFFDFLIVLAVLGSIIGIVLATIVGFVRVGFMFAPWLAIGGLIILLMEFLK